MVSAIVVLAVNFLAALRDVDFKWYAAWNVFLGAASGVDFVAAAGAATVVLDFLVIVCLVVLLVLSVIVLFICRCSPGIGVVVASVSVL